MGSRPLLGILKGAIRTFWSNWFDFFCEWNFFFLRKENARYRRTIGEQITAGDTGKEKSGTFGSIPTRDHQRKRKTPLTTAQHHRMGVILPQATIYTIWHTRDYDEVERTQGRKPKLQTHREIWYHYMDQQRKLVSSILAYLCAETREQSTAFLSGLEGVLHKVSHVGALSVYVKLILISIGQSSPFISSQVHSIRC